MGLLFLQQTNNSRKTCENGARKVKNKAKIHWSEDELPVGDSVMVEITYFYEENVSSER